MAFSLGGTLICFLSLAPLFGGFHSCLASRVLLESKKSAAKDIGVDSFSVSHMLVPNLNPVLPAFEDHLLFPIPNPVSPKPFPTPNPVLPKPLPNPNPAFPIPGLPGLPKFPPIPLPGLPKLPPIPPIPFPFLPNIPPFNPFLPVPPIPGHAKKSADSALSTDQRLTSNP